MAIGTQATVAPAQRIELDYRFPLFQFAESLIFPSSHFFFCVRDIRVFLAPPQRYFRMLSTLEFSVDSVVCMNINISEAITGCSHISYSPHFLHWNVLYVLASAISNSIYKCFQLINIVREVFFFSLMSTVFTVFVFFSSVSTKTSSEVACELFYGPIIYVVHIMYHACFANIRKEFFKKKEFCKQK